MRLTLVGYRASGKSSVGRLAAQRLGWRFLDADAVVSERIGAIAAYFASHGEAAFREREAAVLAELLDGTTPLVLATGGGVVLREENRARLRQRGGVVAYLHAPVEVLQARLRRDTGGRPSLTGASVADEVPRLLAQREPLYREVATLVVDAAAPLAAVAETLVANVEKSCRKPV